MSKIVEKIKSIETSKLLLFIVTTVWIASIVINYVMGYLTIESVMVLTTFNAINNAFIIELGYYGLKSGIENVTKIKTDKKIGDLIDEAVDNIDESINSFK